MSPSTSEIRVRLVPSNMFKPSSCFLTNRSKAVILLRILFDTCFSCLSVQCSLVVTCWERTDLFALFCVVFSSVSVTFPYGVLVQVWYLIVMIPDLCILLYFYFVKVTTAFINIFTFALIWFFTSQSTIFQLCQGRSPWVELVLSKD